MLKFSVVIPAYNEAEMIEKAVAALLEQNIPRDQFEIIVVDNASTDDTREAARRAGADLVVYEGVKGTNIARQSGVLASHGEIVAFLDADCQPQPNWLRRIEKLLNQPGVSAVSGPYDYGFPRFRQIMANLYFDFIFRHADRVLYTLFRRKAGIMLGGNFASRREYLDKIGGLPPMKFYGDDAAIGITLAAQIGKVSFTRELIVRSSPRRMEREGFVYLTLKYAWHFFRIYFVGIPSSVRDGWAAAARKRASVENPPVTHQVSASVR
ncbi:MAG TPA: glycosyltransferase family 2 protein [Blastocatellia bacterium]|nr:glycosyltransferase family 2 protein [Blastocatellia bacterium]